MKDIIVYLREIHVKNVPEEKVKELKQHAEHIESIKVNYEDINIENIKPYIKLVNEDKFNLDDFKDIYDM